MESEFLSSLRQALAGPSRRDLPLAPNDPLLALGLDSIALAELVLRLEERFQVVLEPGELDLRMTFAELETLIARKRGASGS